nr:MAG TPA: hypothetical protein [Inoviridae sp.]
MPFYKSLWIPLDALPRKYTLPVGRVIGARFLRRSPCPRGVASETGGQGGKAPWICRFEQFYFFRFSPAEPILALFCLNSKQF